MSTLTCLYCDGPIRSTAFDAEPTMLHLPPVGDIELPPVAVPFLHLESLVYACPDGASTFATPAVVFPGPDPAQDTSDAVVPFPADLVPLANGGIITGPTFTDMREGDEVVIPARPPVGVADLDGTLYTVGSPEWATLVGELLDAHLSLRDKHDTLALMIRRRLQALECPVIPLSAEQMALHLRAVSGGNAEPSPAGNPSTTTDRATDQVDAGDPFMRPVPRGGISFPEPEPLDVRHASTRTEAMGRIADALGLPSALLESVRGSNHWSSAMPLGVVPHWTDDENLAADVRRVFRMLPPVAWDVTVWAADENSVAGTLDAADAHALIGAILNAVGHLAGPVFEDCPEMPEFDRVPLIPVTAEPEPEQLLTSANADLCSCGEVVIAHGVPSVRLDGRRHAVDECRRMIRDNPQA